MQHHSGLIGEQFSHGAEGVLILELKQDQHHQRPPQHRHQPGPIRSSLRGEQLARGCQQRSTSGSATHKKVSLAHSGLSAGPGGATPPVILTACQAPCESGAREPKGAVMPKDHRVHVAGRVMSRDTEQMPCRRYDRLSSETPAVGVRMLPPPHTLQE
ncbi:unnamed protein product [Lota lota]